MYSFGAALGKSSFTMFGWLATIIFEATTVGFGTKINFTRTKVWKTCHG